MEQELKRIKKLYGEKMMRMCREMFPGILEEKGKLLDILETSFEPNHFLYDDIVKFDLKEKFKNYIYGLVQIQNKENEVIDKTPEQLLKDAGYDLYECTTESDIQSFKKYYAKGEELCTFNGDRLNVCRVFFAVKKNVEDIKRENFPKPERQDLYGTSVISIQFTKDGTNTLSIKNRYNHTVGNPDATFSNNLDNIIEGLTNSFEQHYGIVQKYKSKALEIPHYVVANDGKYYKYNYEINNTYYCPNNIIINNFDVERYEKEKYIVLDYFVLDKTTKRIWTHHIVDSFHRSIGEIKKIEEENKGDIKEVRIFNEVDEPIVITLDKENKIIGLKNNIVERVDNNFLQRNDSLSHLEMKNLKYVGYYFLKGNKLLEKLDLPELIEVGDDFISRNSMLMSFSAPKLEKTGDGFLSRNKKITHLSLPNLTVVGDCFFSEMDGIQSFECPKLERIGNYFLHYNYQIKKLDLPNLKQIGDYFMYDNEWLSQFSAPKLEKVGKAFLNSNLYLDYLDLPCLKEVENSFLANNKKLMSFEAPKLQRVRDNFLAKNSMLYSLKLPSLVEAGSKFLSCNDKLMFFDAPNLERLGGDSFGLNTTLKFLNINLLYNNPSILFLHPEREKLLNNESKKSKRT